MGVYYNNPVSGSLIPVAGFTADMQGATSVAAGAHGLVPAPQPGDEDKALKGDGTWGSVNSGEIISYQDWSQLTPAEQASGDWYIPDYPESAVPPMGGFDTTPTANSINPVTSGGIKTAINAVDGHVGTLSNLTTTAKGSAVAAINEVNTAVAKCECLVITKTGITGTGSSVTTTITNANIETDMVVVNSVLSNPAAQVGSWSWSTDTAGQITLSGAVNGTTDITIYLMKGR